LYERYFGLIERPFSIAPDPHYLYMSSRHKEAMAHLSYGLSQGGCFIVLTGEVGTGKTTLCRNLLNDLPGNVDVALILNANVSETELLQMVCDELAIPSEEGQSQKKLLDLINQHLLKTFSENKHTVLIIDEAQLLKRDVLEQIRLLTNLETTKSKLLQIILIGQPELYGLLSRNDLRQLAQRVTARYHLGALQRNEIEEYVNFRLGVAGCRKPLFTRQALNKMHSLTDGIPRKINVLADHALLATYSQNKTSVDSKVVAKAAKEVFIVSQSSEGFAKTKLPAFSYWWVLIALVLLVNAFAWVYFKEPRTVAVNGGVEVISVPLGVDASDLVGGLDAQEQLTNTPQSVVIDGVSDSEGAKVLGTSVVSESFLTIEPEDVLVTSSVKTALPSRDVLPREGDVVSNVDLGRVLDVSGDRTGRIFAFRQLALIWGVALPEQILKSVCQATIEQGLGCLSLSQWSDLESYNRPAIVVLEHQGKAHRVIVRSIGDGVADIVIGDAAHRVSLDELRQRWTGAGVILWRSPVDIDGEGVLPFGCFACSAEIK